ncbi:MAG: HAD family hydrolase [Myxococcales bacterium]
MIATALFDVDGTLVDSVDLHAQAWQQAFAHFGKQVPFADVRYQIGKGGDQLLPVFFSREEIARRGKEIEEFRGALFKREMMPLVRPFPQVRALVERVRGGGCKVVVASSAKEDELRRYLELCAIDDLVDGATSKDEAARSKPYPDIFAAALDQVPGARKEEAAVVGDSPWDVQAASRLGVRSLGMLCGGFPPEVLRAEGAIALYRDPADLLARYGESAFASGPGEG